MSQPLAETVPAPIAAAPEAGARASPPAGPAPAGRASPPGAAGEVLIRAERLGKRFKLYARPSDRLVEWLTGGRVSRHTDFWALRDVSFEVRRGRCLGILGVNGSGKSTLLKIVSGAMYPTEGRYEVRGRILSLIELGAGLNPQLTGRQNIFNAAQLLNFGPDYARERIEEIEAFAELGAFFDRPVRMYSSGMKVRLAFSMFACFRPEVFVVDEALSVGDVFFQQKCVQRIDEMLEAGTTMLFVSHDQAKVRRLSDEAIVLHRGRVIFHGAPEEAASRYNALQSGGAGAPARRPAPGRPASARAGAIRRNLLPPNPSRHGTGAMTIEAVGFENERGQEATVVEMMQTATIRVRLRAHRAVAEPSCGLHLYDRLSNLVFACGTRQLGVAIPPMEPGDERTVAFRLTFAVAPGPYTLMVGCSEPDPARGTNAGIAHDRVSGLGPIHVTFDRSRLRPFFGAAHLPLSAEV